VEFCERYESFSPVLSLILTGIDILSLMAKASSRQNVYIMCDDAYMYATDPNTGDVHWRKSRTPFPSGALANVYCRAT
jgi:outer membrane protein assembly factor BamB